MEAPSLPHRSRLVEIVDAVTPLTVEDGLFRARCVFHPDGGRSFYLDARGSFYHCFGCGAHGDERRWSERPTAMSS